MVFIFDMGGVVCGNVIIVPRMARALSITEAQFFTYCAGFPVDTSSCESVARAYSSGLIGDMCRGKISSKEFWHLFAERSGISVQTDYWRLFFQPQKIPEIYGAIAQLRKKHRVVCGTNTLDSHYRVHLERGDYTCFDTVYASHIMEIIKPNPLFWQTILTAENIAPADALFFDDTEANVAAAQTVGIRSMLVTSPQSVLDALSPWL